MRKSRLSNVKQSRLIEHFVAGTTARCAADLVGAKFILLSTFGGMRLTMAHFFPYTYVVLKTCHKMLNQTTLFYIT